MAKRRKSTVKSKPKKAGKKGRPPKGTVDWKPIFLAHIQQGEHVRDAAAAANVAGTTPYHERQNNEAFRAAWDEAQKIGTVALEREAARRAFHGYLKPVFQGGKKAGEVREYSDTLMIFLLKSRRPDVYRDKMQINHADANGDPLPPPVTVISFGAPAAAPLPMPIAERLAHQLPGTNGHHANGTNGHHANGSS